MKVTIDISDDKLAEFRTGFLRACPLPVTIDGIPQYTEQQWVKVWIINKLKQAYINGKNILSQQSINSNSIDIS